MPFVRLPQRTFSGSFFECVFLLMLCTASWISTIAKHYWHIPSISLFLRCKVNGICYVCILNSSFFKWIFFYWFFDYSFFVIKYILNISKLEVKKMENNWTENGPKYKLYQVLYSFILMITDGSSGINMKKKPTTATLKWNKRNNQ